MDKNYTILHCHTMLSNGVTNIDSVTKYTDYVEKAKELKPDNKALWGNYLLNIYWKLNRAEYDSLEKELGY